MTYVRKINVELKERVETGAIQIGDDWPGTFIRGDDSFHYSAHLREILDENEIKGFSRFLLEKLYNTLRECKI